MDDKSEMRKSCRVSDNDRLQSPDSLSDAMEGGQGNLWR